MREAVFHMQSAATAEKSIGQEQALNSAQLVRVAHIHAAIFFFYAVDCLFLSILGLLGTLPMSFGLGYWAVGWCSAGVAVLAFRRGRKRPRQLELNNLLMSTCAAAQMLGTALLEPSVGGLMLMSMMTVFAASALQLATRPLLWVWLGLAGGAAATMLASGDALQLPMATPAHRLLCAVWFAWLLGKCGMVNVEGTRLRLQVSQANASLVQALGEVRKLATTDELTVIGNRRSIVSDLAAAVTAVDDSGASVAVALFDIDHFKQVNDRFGHATGDAVLREFAALVSHGLRPADRVGRYGGEEFLLVLQQVHTAAAARDTAERMRQAIQAFDWQRVVDGLQVTASAGVALVRRDEPTDRAIARADRALYAAKAGGRNRVVLADCAAALAEPLALPVGY